MKRLISLVLVTLALVIGVVATTAFTSSKKGSDEFQVTITNLTQGQIFTPILVASHKNGVKLFELGEMASDELAALAEAGDVAP